MIKIFVLTITNTLETNEKIDDLIKYIGDTKKRQLEIL